MSGFFLSFQFFGRLWLMAPKCGLESRIVSHFSEDRKALALVVDQNNLVRFNFQPALLFVPKDLVFQCNRKKKTVRDGKFPEVPAFLSACRIDEDLFHEKRLADNCVKFCGH